MVRRAFLELMRVKRDVVIAPDGRIFRRSLLHLIRVDVHRLNVLPLELALGAVVLEIVLWSANAGDVATHRAIAWSTGLLIVGAKIGVVSEEIKLVAACF